MARDTDDDRIRRKAHEIWEGEGRPHGRDQAHWDAAKEIIALQDSMDETLLPRDAGAEEPEEPALAVTNQGDMPSLTDQGRDDLTDTAREPDVTKPSHAIHSLGDTAGGVARPAQQFTPQGDEPGTTTTPAPKVAPVTPTPSNPMLGEPAPRGRPPGAPDAAVPGSGAPPKAQAPASASSGPITAAPAVSGAAVTARATPKSPAKPVPVTKGKPGGRR